MKKPHDINGLIKLVKTICLTHHGIADFNYDADLNFDNTNYNYPLVFIESEKMITSNGGERVYSIAIQVADKPSSSLTDDMLLTEAKVEYLTDDIYRLLSNYGVNITDANSINYHDKGEDVVIIRRTEFSLTLYKNITRYGNPAQIL